MSCSKYRFFILTGEPGVGKTTLTKKMMSLIVAKGIKTTGFYTEEVRKNGIREGFDVVTVEAKRGRLAREHTLLDMPVRCRLGKYGVLVQEFENIALPCLVQPESSQTHLLVIDEIGKMELFSEAFKSNIKIIFSDVSNNIVLATIPVRRGDSLIENIRNHSKAKVWTVTRENRNNIHEEILKEMKVVLKID